VKSHLAEVVDLDAHREQRNQPRKERLTYKQLGERLRRSVRQLKRDKRDGMPVEVEYPGWLLFDEDDCLAWYEARARAKR
jgi:hypothetical protein